jgi:hypothetical protein
VRGKAMDKKNSTEKQSAIAKQKEVGSIDTAFDFTAWFFFWKQTVLRELAIEAFSLYYYIENAIDD